MNIYLIGVGDISPLEAEVAGRFPESAVCTAKSLPKELISPEREDDKSKAAVVQPVYLLPGIKYDELRRETAGFSGKIILGKALLHDEQTVHRLSAILAEQYGEQHTLFVGHGTRHPSAWVYSALNEALQRESGGRFFLSVLDAHAQLHIAETEKYDDRSDIMPVPGTRNSAMQMLDFAAVREWIAENKIKQLRLVPLMISMGAHAKNEILGGKSAGGAHGEIVNTRRTAYDGQIPSHEHGESVNAQLTALGIETLCVAKGLIEYPAVRKMFIESLVNDIRAINIHLEKTI